MSRTLLLVLFLLMVGSATSCVGFKTITSTETKVVFPPPATTTVSMPPKTYTTTFTMITTKTPPPGAIPQSYLATSYFTVTVDPKLEQQGLYFYKTANCLESSRVRTGDILAFYPDGAALSNTPYETVFPLSNSFTTRLYFKANDIPDSFIKINGAYFGREAQIELSDNSSYQYLAMLHYVNYNGVNDIVLSLFTRKSGYAPGTNFMISVVEPPKG